jgi:imidazolonepropionase-like amidohydrolase
MGKINKSAAHIIIFLVFLSIFFVGTLTAEQLAIKAGFILDTKTGQLLKDKTIIIKDNQIFEITDSIPPNTKIIDLSDSYLLPGLIDMHTHIIGNLSKDYSSNLFQSPHRSTIGGVVNAKKTLMAGFTSVRNVGAPNFMDVALRNAINADEVPGPRMFISGPSIGITGGHCDKNELNHEYEQSSDGIADGPWEVRKMVRLNAKYGVDLIKFCATGGVFSKGTKVGLRQYTLEEMEAMVNEAHTRGIKIAAHAHGTEGIEYAIRAGVDSIEHASFLDIKTAKLAKKYGVTLVMDIYNTEYTLSQGEINGIPEENLKKDLETGERQRQSFSLAVKHGVNLVYGTDSGVYPHGDNAKQFSRMATYGMSPLEAIQSATIGASKLLGLSEKVGQISPGFYADIIAVDDNPLDHLETLEKVTFVMKNGQVFKNPN